MSASRETTRLTKKDKKLKKKQQRSRETLENHEGIQIAENPTKVLCVHNGGLDNGVGREELSAIFNTDGCVADIIMLPRKPYSFVCFSKLEDAARVKEEFNGFDMHPNEKRKHLVTLYLSFVTKVPTSVAPCSNLPQGLIILEDFVSVEEEDLLISSLQWKWDSKLKHREVKHYGYEFKYGINDVDADDPLPESIPNSCDGILQKALKTGYVQHLPDQLTVNKYHPGQGIPPHVDTPGAFEDGIMSLSLLSQVVMEFTHPDGRHLSVLLPRRSLLIMTGESRYVWSHGITPRKSDIVTLAEGLDLVMRETRLSFTFRKIIHPKDRVNRIVPFQENNLNVLMPKSETDAAKLENSHVQQVYEEIADHFSGTRHTPWPKISKFINEIPAGSMMVDIGCGNGKYLGINKSIFEVGSDRSFNLTQICHERSHETYIGDVLNIPLRNSSFDYCLCIAVIHHMSTHKRREKAVKELLRILRPGGKLLIYVWAMEQELQKVKSKYLKESKLHGSNYGDGIHVTKGMPHNAENNKYNDEMTQILDTFTNSCASSDKETVLEIPNSCTNASCVESLSCIDDQHLSSTSQDTTQTSTLPDSCDDHNAIKDTNTCPNCLSVHKNRTHFQQQDVLVPWERKDKDSNTKCFHRYYHVFKEGELEEMCGMIEGCQVIDRYYDQGNWAVILQKQ